MGVSDRTDVSRAGWRLRSIARAADRSRPGGDSPNGVPNDAPTDAVCCATLIGPGPERALVLPADDVPLAALAGPSATSAVAAYRRAAGQPVCLGDGPLVDRPEWRLLKADVRDDDHVTLSLLGPADDVREYLFKAENVPVKGVPLLVITSSFDRDARGDKGGAKVFFELATALYWAWHRPFGRRSAA